LAERTQRENSRSFNERRRRELAMDRSENAPNKTKPEASTISMSTNSASQLGIREEPRRPAPRAARGIIRRQIATAAIVPPYNCLI
jgi:hypothetical protein